MRRQQQQQQQLRLEFKRFHSSHHHQPCDSTLSQSANARPPAISNIGTEKWFNFRFNFLQWFTSKFQVQVLASFDLRDSCVYSHPARGAKPARARSAALALGPMHSPPDEKQRIRAVVSEAEFGKPHFPQVCQRLGCFWPKCFFP